jgi:hypothetical protein
MVASHFSLTRRCLTAGRPWTFILLRYTWPSNGLMLSSFNAENPFEGCHDAGCTRCFTKLLSKLSTGVTLWRQIRLFSRMGFAPCLGYVGGPPGGALPRLSWCVGRYAVELWEARQLEEALPGSVRWPLAEPLSGDRGGAMERTDAQARRATASRLPRTQLKILASRLHKQ